MLFLNFLRQHFYFLIGATLGLSLSIFIGHILDNNTPLCSLHLNNSSRNNINALSFSVQDEYEPQINLAGKPLKAQKIPQQIVRPRYFSTELGIKEKLIVCIISSSNSIETNAVSINKTIAHLTEKIVYFVETPNKLNLSKLYMPDIIAFIDSRHMLKPFHIFKYLIDNYLQEFDYFYLIYDSSFINIRKLYDLINKISVGETLYLGEKLNKNSLFCNLNSGILLSSNILKSLSHNIDWCIKNIHSDSDDINVGRCITHSVNVQCVSNYMGQTYTGYNIEQYTNIQNALQYLRKQNNFNNAITIYPIVRDSYFYILHTYFTKKGLDNDLNEIKKLRRSIQIMSNKFEELKENLTWPIGNQPGNKPNSRFDVLHWKYFTNMSVYLRDDFTTVSNFTNLELKDIENVLLNSIQYIYSKYSNKLKYQNLINGYKKFDMSRGMDYILDIEFINTINNKLVHKRIEICKPLGKIDLLRIPYVTENTRIHILVTVKHDDVNMTLKYLQQYKKVCLEKKEKTFLMLILIYEPQFPGKESKYDIYKQIKDKSLRFSKDFKRDNNKVSWLSIKLPKNSNEYNFRHDFLLNFAILDLALKKFSSDSLIFYTNPYTEFFNDFLNRIRMNTINGYQIYIPIPFHEYNSIFTQRQSPEIDINKNNGRFNIFTYEHISFYVKDYVQVRESFVNKIPKVLIDKDILNLTKHVNNNHLVDLNILKMFEMSSSLHLLQGTEPNLRVYYKSTQCDHYEEDKELHKQCIFLRNHNLASRSQMSKSVL